MCVDVFALKENFKKSRVQEQNDGHLVDCS
jgi:hypothetical protein